MKKLLLLVLLVASLSTVTAQELIKGTVDITKGDVVSEYPGGLKVFYEYIATEMKSLTKKKGKVVVTFIVEKDGSVSNINVVKSLSRKIDKNLVTAISRSPKWTPG